MEGSDALDVAEVHPDEEGPADDVLVGNEAPEARVLGIVAVVAHHEVVSCGNLAGDPFGGVTTVFRSREIACAHAVARRQRGVDQDAVAGAGQLLAELARRMEAGE